MSFLKLDDSNLMQISDVILLQGHLNLNSSIEYC